MKRKLLKYGMVFAGSALAFFIISVGFKNYYGANMDEVGLYWAGCLTGAGLAMKIK